MNYKVYDQYSRRRAHEAAHPDSHFFDDKTLRFFGETMSSMRLLKNHAVIKDVMGQSHECYVLSSSQKPPFGNRHRVCHYFDTETLEQVNAF